MSDPFDEMLEDLHNDDAFGLDADYRRGGNGIPVRVRIRRSIIEPNESPLGLRIKARADTISVRLADCPHLAKDDQFTVDPDTNPTILVVTEIERDAEGLSATATVRRS